MTGRATRIGAALMTAFVVAASLDLASKPASAQPGGRVPSELWSEYPLDPAKGETPPPVAGDEGAGVPPAGVDTDRPGETRPVEPATPRGEDDTLLASPVLWVLLVVLLLGSALVIAATRALPQAIESVTAMPARLRAHDLSAPLRVARSAPVRLARRATVDVPRTLSRLAVPAGAPVRLVRRARRPVVAAPRRVEVPAEPRRAREDTSVADTLVERVRGYVAPAEKAPDVDKRPVVAAGVERCEIRWWRGYLKSHFYACAVTKEGVEVVVAMSPTFWWRHAEPPSQTKAAVAARMALVETLVAQGWRAEPAPHDPATPATWFAGRFRQRVRAKAHAPV
jgi:hypothetical protein